MSADETKDNLESEVQRVDKKIAEGIKDLDDAIEKLLREKEEVNADEKRLEIIDKEIETIIKNRDLLLSKQQRIHQSLTPIEELENTILKTDAELLALEERHEVAKEKLETQKEFLEERLSSILNFDLMATAIADTIKDETEMFHSVLDRLNSERKALLMRTDLSPEEMQALLRAIDRSIENNEYQHATSLGKLNKQMADLRSASKKDFSIINPSDILDEIKKLKEIRNNATASQILLIDAKLAELKRRYQQLDSIIDWKQLSNDLEFNALLQKRGLRMTKSGNLVTNTGQVISVAEAKATGLLDGIETELMTSRGIRLTASGRIKTDGGEIFTKEEAERLGLLYGLRLDQLFDNQASLAAAKDITLTASGRILTGSGRLLSKSEAERLGLLDGFNLDEMYNYKSSSESITSSATTASGMSSSDVHYLKTVLGRPLALALAEITAKQPRDPIHYLGHWLYKYRYNQEVDEETKLEFNALIEERERLARLNLHERAEMEVKDVLLDLLGRVDNAIERYDIERELQRIRDEDAANEAEYEALEEEARDTLGVYNGPTSGQKLA